jgi:hypothetical protein
MRHGNSIFIAAVIAVSAVLAVGPAKATVYTWKEPTGVLVMTNDPQEVPDDTERVQTHETAVGGGSAGERPAHADEASATEVDGDAARDRSEATVPRSAPRSEERVRASGVSASGSEERVRASDVSTSGVSPSEASRTQPMTQPEQSAEPAEPPPVRESTLALYALLREPAPREPPPFIVSIVPDSGRPLSTAGEVGSGRTSTRMRSGSGADMPPSMTAGRGSSLAAARESAPPGMMP